MSRILLGLAGLTGIILLLSFTVGFACEGREYVHADVPLTPAQRLFTVHLLSGLLASLLSLLLHSLVFTYFIGTGRWVQEVVQAYGFPGSIWERARALKMRALPFILGSILSVIAAATLGAATDRGLLDRNAHLVAAVLAVGCNFWSYLREYQVVAANNQLIIEIMEQVNRKRRERGLDRMDQAEINARPDCSNAEQPG
jgi:hypothetical protein